MKYKFHTHKYKFHNIESLRIPTAARQARPALEPLSPLLGPILPPGGRHGGGYRLREATPVICHLSPPGLPRKLGKNVYLEGLGGHHPSSAGMEFSRGKRIPGTCSPDYGTSTASLWRSSSDFLREAIDLRLLHSDGWGGFPRHSGVGGWWLKTNWNVRIKGHRLHGNFALGRVSDIPQLCSTGCGFGAPYWEDRPPWSPAALGHLPGSLGP